MDSKEATAGDEANINIDINGDVANNSSGSKNNAMSLDPVSDKRIGLTKEELKEFADQPFWVRLRNILFASFWIVWLSILIIAIGYVIKSPGCVKLASASNVTEAIVTSTASPSSG